ncbi:hypothetical protein BV20DRAFT_1037822 [Pilatotrama ljubarskyi]|nr:hypothetical protein BV20DRAFT_1037822 [Pilatotrama ljubarskyi]
MFFRSVFALVAVAAMMPYRVYAQEPNCARNYTVSHTDLQVTGVCSFQLESVSADKVNANYSNLAIGEPLCLRIIGQDCDIVHVVEAADSCEAIAEVAGTTVDILLANNPNVDSECINISIGEVLCVADEVIVVKSTACGD